MRGKLLLSAILVSLAGCKTYVLEPASLKRQLLEVSPQQAAVTGPFGEQHMYLANSIRSIECFTKDGQPFHLLNSPAIEARITLKSGKRKLMYFDGIAIRNDTLFGSPSRFLSSLKTRIPFADIVKIEVQNGGKQFSYNK